MGRPYPFSCTLSSGAKLENEHDSDSCALRGLRVRLPSWVFCRQGCRQFLQRSVPQGHCSNVTIDDRVAVSVEVPANFTKEKDDHALRNDLQTE